VSGTDKTVGFIDVGTNSVHMLVVRFYEESLGTPVYQDKETVRIGQSLYSKGAIDPETIQKTKIVAENFVKVAKSYGAEEIEAMATCAAREASNRQDLIRAFREVGVDLHVIPGLEEARLIRLGVLGPDAGGRTLCIDVGGGSTEISLDDGEGNVYLDSLSLGAVRLAYGSGIEQKGKVTGRQYDALRRMVDTASYRSVGKVREMGFERAVGSSGTIMAIGEMCGSLRGDKDGSWFTYDELSSLMKDVCSRDVNGRLKIPKMTANRADIIVAGGAVVEELMFLYGIDRMEVSSNGMREGMRTDYLMEHGQSQFDLRWSSVIGLVSRCGSDRRHTDTVRKYALDIYDQLADAAVIIRDDHMRELLGYAAELHDVGEFISYERHAIHSYTIIRNSYLPGFDDRELELMALMARFHHGTVPGPSSKYFSDLEKDEVAPLRECALILKIADILDRSRDASVDSIEMSAVGGSVVMRIMYSKDISMQLWKLKTIKDEFSNVFGRKLRIVDIKQVQ
jgi:exopolyphosphatase/guanosine-5'-triphosphate,3'-diphosphate pyrophosphatase